MAVTIQVAVSNATVYFDKLYSYTVPPQLAENVCPGGMVLVPFGRGGKARMGVVLQCSQTPQPPAEWKQIYDAAPQQAALTEELLQLVYYLREQTFCTYYEAVKAVLPYGAQYKAVYTPQPHLQQQLVRHTETVYTAGEEPSKMTPQQRQVYDFVRGAVISRKDILNAGLSASAIQTLCKKGVLTAYNRDVSMELYADVPYQPEVLELSAQQQQAYRQLCTLLHGQTPAAALLHGVTGSGKTLVFLALLRETVEKMHRTALVLVPEILLTPQMITRLKANFGARVAVQHSALSHTERLLQWRQIQSGAVDIVVGTRSAVFAPLQNIGLIVMDEEQEHTYHSESAPRYSAREVAKKRAAAHGALLLMASATPSAESYYAAQQGQYHLVQLSQRYNNMALPQVETVDMREELAAGNAGAISRRLAKEIGANLQAGQQTILLLNRRGYKTVGMCKKCRTVVKCSACSVPMVYHKNDKKLMCHYCGKVITPIPAQCAECGGELSYTGFGTQRAEEEICELFPQARVLRMDLDSTSKKDARRDMLQSFADGHYDIMLGTQMVAKGLDFENVTLVGVLGIDQLLFAQGYKAYENVFSLVTQVVGRGGRAAQAGRALIQTVDPQNPILALAAKQDYEAFYQQEIRFRKLNLYPPFCSICTVGFSAEKEEWASRASRAFADILIALAKQRADIPLRTLGPVPMHIAMVNKKYRYVLTLKCRNDKKFRALLRDAAEEYSKQGYPAKASNYIDFYADADL